MNPVAVRGVSSRNTKLIIWAAFGTVLGTAAAVLWKHTGDPLDYFRYQVPPGQFLFILVKVSGLIAMAFLVFQIVLALTRKHLVSDMTIGQHKVLGMVTLTIIVFHVTCFVVAVSIRSKTPVFDLLWPDFHNFYRTWLSVGLIGLWVLCLGIIAMLRGGAWRRFHPWLMLFGFILAFLHSLQVGSETGAGAMIFISASYLCAVLGALVARSWYARGSSTIPDP